MGHQTLPNISIGTSLQSSYRQQSAHVLPDITQHGCHELAKYDFSLEYQKGKNNTVADTLSQIWEEWLSDQEADKLLESIPMIPGIETIVKIF